MLGTGTKEDPYQIKTCDDLYEMNNVLTDNCFFLLMNDIDFNEQNFWDISTLSLEKNFTLDGNNKTVKNIYLQDKSFLNIGSSSQDFITIKNLRLEGVQFQNTVAAPIISITVPGQLDFINCEFAFKIYTSSKVIPEPIISSPSIAYSPKRRLINCTFNIDYYVNNIYCNGLILQDNLNAKTSIDNCEIKINLYMNQAINTNDISRGFYIFYASGKTTNTTGEYVILNNNCIFLNIYNMTKSTSNRLALTNGNIKLYNTSFVLKNIVNKLDSIIINNYSDAIQSIFIYDKETMVSTVITGTNSGKIKPLTTAQMKDKEYLNSIGFPIA